MRVDVRRGGVAEGSLAASAAAPEALWLARVRGVKAAHAMRRRVCRDRESVREEERVQAKRNLVQRVQEALHAQPSHAARSCEPLPTVITRRTWKWSDLLQRVVKIDVLQCDKCGARCKVLELLTDPFVVAKFLEALGESTIHANTDSRSRTSDARGRADNHGLVGGRDLEPETGRSGQSNGRVAEAEASCTGRSLAYPTHDGAFATPIWPESSNPSFHQTTSVRCADQLTNGCTLRIGLALRKWAVLFLICLAITSTELSAITFVEPVAITSAELVGIGCMSRHR
jgi:hypothetical protein